MMLLVCACVVTVAGFELDEGGDSKYVPNAYVVEMDSLSALGRRSDEVRCLLFVFFTRELNQHAQVGS